MISSPDAFSNYDFFYSSNWWPPVQCTCAHYWAQIQNSTSRFLNEKGELVNHMQKKLHMQDNCLYSNQGDMACFGISLYVGTFWFSCRLQFRRISCSLTHYGQKINWIQKWQFFDRYFSFLTTCWFLSRKIWKVTYFIIALKINQKYICNSKWKTCRFWN